MFTILAHVALRHSFPDPQKRLVVNLPRTYRTYNTVHRRNTLSGQGIDVVEIHAEHEPCGVRGRRELVQKTTGTTGVLG
jgi:hypothetical protein